MTNPNTHPEQIVDKNGKVTTVHKSNSKGSAANSKAGKAAKPSIVSDEDARVGRAFDSIVGGLARDEAYGAELRLKRSAVRFTKEMLIERELSNFIKNIDTNITQVEFALDYSDEDGSWSVDVDVAIDKDGMSKMYLTPEENELIEKAVYSYGVRRVFDNPRVSRHPDFHSNVFVLDDQPFPADGGINRILDPADRVDTIDGLTKLENRLAAEIRKVEMTTLRNTLQAIDPDISEIEYEVTPGDEPDEYNIEVNDFVLRNGFLVDEYDDIMELREAASEVNMYNIHDREEAAQPWGKFTLKL